MKLNMDKKADALYLRLDDSTIVESVGGFAGSGARLQRIKRSRRRGIAPPLETLLQTEPLYAAIRDGLMGE